KLFNHNEEIGRLRQSAFSNLSEASLRDTKLKFKNKGGFSYKTEITDLNSNELIGTIKSNSWGTKIIITFTQKEYSWKNDNFWGTKWSISEPQQKLISYKSSSNKGEIEATTDNNVLLLCGLFIYNYYVTIMTLVVIITAVLISRA